MPGQGDPVTQWVGGWVGPESDLDAVEKRKISLPCQKSNPGRPARSYTDRAIPTPVYGSSVKTKSDSEENLFKIFELKCWII
jgi:hypothetical protein